MKRVYMLLLTIIVIGACKKNEGVDTTTCVCTNSDGEEVGSYPGITEGACAAKETTDITCGLE